MRTVPLCQLADLEEGKAKGFDLFDEGRDALFVVRNGDQLVAYENVCPHHGASLPWRKDQYLNAAGSKIVCNAHGALFSIEDGECVQGAALGCSLKRVPLRVDQSGMIEAEYEPRENPR